MYRYVDGLVGTQVDRYASRSIGGIFLAIFALSQFSGTGLAADGDGPGSAYWNPEISALAISQDGDLVAASGVDGAIHIWDAKTGALRHRLWRKAANPAMRHVALPIAFQPQGHTLAAAGDGQNVGIWDAKSGAFVRTLVGENRSGEPCGTTANKDATGLPGGVSRWLSTMRSPPNKAVAPRPARPPKGGRAGRGAPWWRGDAKR